MKYTKEDIKEAFKNRKKTKFEKALDKIKPQKMTVKQKQTVDRHVKGLIDIVKELDLDVHSGYTPKCKKCYDENGWINKCVCKEVGNE